MEQNLEWPWRNVHGATVGKAVSTSNGWDVWDAVRATWRVRSVSEQDAEVTLRALLAEHADVQPGLYTHMPPA